MCFVLVFFYQRISKRKLLVVCYRQFHFVYDIFYFAFNQKTWGIWFQQSSYNCSRSACNLFLRASHFTLILFFFTKRTSPTQTQRVFKSPENFEPQICSKEFRDSCPVSRKKLINRLIDPFNDLISVKFPFFFLFFQINFFLLVWFICLQFETHTFPLRFPRYVDLWTWIKVESITR